MNFSENANTTNQSNTYTTVCRQFPSPLPPVGEPHREFSETELGNTNTPTSSVSPFLNPTENATTTKQSNTDLTIRRQCTVSVNLTENVADDKTRRHQNKYVVSLSRLNLFENVFDDKEKKQTNKTQQKNPHKKTHDITTLPVFSFGESLRECHRRRQNTITLILARKT